MTVLSQDPIIIYSGGYDLLDYSCEFYGVADALHDLPVNFLLIQPWTGESEYNASICADRVKAMKVKHPSHRLVILANTYPELQYLRDVGVDAIFANQNMLVHRDNYFPLSGVTKSFDAVYNGQFLDFKRHRLASAVPNLAIIGYNFETAYARETYEHMNKANFLNYSPDTGGRWLSPRDVNLVYNKSCVGLCLSATEGAMHASMEYLLAGLPVVTTQSMGGRDYYFDGRFVFWAKDDEASIAKAVHALKSENFDPQFIRVETLRKVDRELTSFFEAIGLLFGLNPARLSTDLRERWFKVHNQANDKLMLHKDIEGVVAQARGIMPI